MLQFNLYGLMTFSNFACCSFILWILLSRNKKDPRTLSFSAFLFFICAWSFGLFLWQSLPGVEARILCYKLAVAAAILIVSSLVHFVHIILGIDKENKRILYFIHALNIFFTYAEIFHFYEGFEERFGWGYFPIVNNLFTVFLVWWVFQVVYMFYLVYAKGVKQRTGVEQVRNKQLLLALVVGFAGGSTNWLISYNVFIPPYFVIGVSIFAIWVGYIVFRHQLFDIEIIIKNTALFAGLLFLAGLIVFTVSYLVTPFFVEIGVPEVYSTFLAFAIFILFFRPTEVYLENVTNRWLFQRKINYENLMNSLGETLKKISTIDALCQNLKNIVTDVLQIKYLEIYVYDSEEDCFKLKRDPLSKNEFPKSFDMQDNIIRFITTNDNIIALDFATNKFLRKSLLEMQAQVLIPLKSANRLIGFAIAGNKLSHKPFDNVDIRAFRAMQTSAATAIDNALTFEKLTQSQIELAQKEKLATIGVLAAGIKHEINNPLFVILGRTEMMLRQSMLKTWSAEKITDYVEKQASSIKYNAARIKDIVARLSDFAKPISNAEMENVNIERAIDDSIQLLGYDEEDLNNVHFKIDIPSDLESQADPRMLVQIFFNLINNAIHAINFNGSITIMTRVDDRIHLTIRDTGEGIPKKHLKKIFDPFFTTKDTTKGDESSIKGTGLGLHLVYNYVKKMNGDIQVESALGKGTQFTITLQKAEAFQGEKTGNE